jgi:hypothetical protein
MNIRCNYVVIQLRPVVVFTRNSLVHVVDVDTAFSSVKISVARRSLFQDELEVFFYISIICHRLP